MKGKILFCKAIAPYFSKKSMENKEGGFELHFQSFEVFNDSAIKGSPVEKLWLKNTPENQLIYNKVCLVAPCSVELVYSQKMYNGRVYPVLSDINITK